MGLFRPSRLAYAHCNVPCGIYDPAFAQNAAETVVKMVEQLEALEVPAADAPVSEVLAFQQAVGRRVTNKEEHAKKCKYELVDVLWTQYFKPEHVERWPDLHEKFFNAGHLCTQNMQEISMEKAQALWAATKEIAEIFAESKS